MATYYEITTPIRNGEKHMNVDCHSLAIAREEAQRLANESNAPMYIYRTAKHASRFVATVKPTTGSR